MIYIVKEDWGLYQNKVNSSLVSTSNCKGRTIRKLIGGGAKYKTKIRAREN